MYKKTDGRRWSYVEVNGIELEMLWDSGASVTVMSKRLWKKIGSPTLKRNAITLCGVFSDKNEEPLGYTDVMTKWNKKIKKIEINIVQEIYPEFIGGINTMDVFGIRLVEVNNIESSLVGIQNTDIERVRKTLSYHGNMNNTEMEDRIRRFGHIFMASKFDLGVTHVVRHEMTVNGGPIMLAPRRQPMHMEQKITHLLDELTQAGVIRKCKSAWNAPLVIVGKKDGSIRMCVDYRNLNAITEKESFPMPNTRFLLDCLADARIFSSIDLGQAYYQVLLAPEIQEYTAFSTREGQFCFNRLPFGLATAPATFQRLMHTLLEGMIFKGVVVYLDDILIYGKNQEEHDKRLEQVFTRIHKAGLKINPEKCEFHKKELLFLGHTVNEWGIQTNKKKIEEIENAEIPKCAKQLRSFLGLTNYYRRFIKDYAKIAAPLHAATTGCEKKIVWTDKCDDSFKTLKGKLCTAPILDYPREDRIFVLDTDASFGAIGAVLSQIKEDGKESVIAYGSRHLTNHEKGYCVTRKELLAVHEYVMHFKEYLYGKKFIARTDHKALIFMNTTKKAISPQFQTWLANLSEYDFELRYRKGEDHGNADGLSRIKGMICTQCQTRHEDAKEEKTRVRHIFTLQKTEAMDFLTTRQQEDQNFVEIIRQLKDKNYNKTNDAKRGYPFNITDNLEIKEGLLTIAKEGKNLILVPRASENEIIKKLHEELCHIGIHKLAHYTKNIFYWPKMETSIQEYIKKCEYCARRKSNQNRTKEIFIPRESSEFLEQIVMDVAHMEEKAGKKYILIIVDRFSKLTSLTPLAKQDEKTIWKALLQNWIYKVGKPRSILSDHGKNFESIYLSNNLKELGIQQEFSSPYQHQSNGLAERAIRTMRDLISSTLAGGCSEKNWLELLPRVEFVINATKQSATGCSPFEIVFGRNINLHSVFDQNVLQSRNIIEEARIVATKAANTMRAQDVSRRGTRFFKVGEEVLVKIEPHKRKKDGIQYEGPYQIQRFISPHQVELQTENKTKLRRIEWLKKWQRF